MAENIEAAFMAPDPGYFILSTCVVALAWAGYNFKVLGHIFGPHSLISLLTARGLRRVRPQRDRWPFFVRSMNTSGWAEAFLMAEYTICLQFVVVFSALIVCLIGW